MKTKARFLGTKPINGMEVSFFSPPHDEPDFLWVDLLQLAAVYMPQEAAERMVRHSHKFDMVSRPVEAAAHDGRIVNIVSRPMATGFCSFVDYSQGHILQNEDDWNLGPAALAFAVASADAQMEFAPLGFEGIARAFTNQGGPGLRGAVDV